MNLIKGITRLQPLVCARSFDGTSFSKVVNTGLVIMSPHSRNMSADKAEPTIINIQGMKDFKTTVLESKKPVLIDFHATWCGPCKLLGPRLEGVMSSYADQIILAKVDIDEIEDAPVRYHVTSVPTVVGIKGGEEVDRFVGLQEEDAIRNFIDKML